MKVKKTPKSIRRTRLPKPSASYTELEDFFNRHDGVELFEQSITEIDPHQEDLERMLLEYWSQPNMRREARQP